MDIETTNLIIQVCKYSAIIGSVGFVGGLKTHWTFSNEADGYDGGSGSKVHPTPAQMDRMYECEKKATVAGLVGVSSLALLIASGVVSLGAHLFGATEKKEEFVKAQQIENTQKIATQEPPALIIFKGLER